MAKSVNQKRKLPILAKLLLERSDEDHPVSTADMVAELERWNISAERKSIYDDMAQLTELGMDIQRKPGKDGGWFVGERDFELAELKLLVDAVQSSRFLTRNKSAKLIKKLEGLASVHQARQLQRQVFVDRRIKNMNESIFYGVDKLHTAISENRVITFRYFEYNMKKERVNRHGGALYRVTPFGLIWDNENYYLAAWDENSRELRHYRVDKMVEITMTEQTGSPRGDWNPEGYAGRHFGMFSGQCGQLKLRCRADMAGVILDRFGQDIMLIPDGDDYFTVTVEVVMSPPFMGWLFGLGPDVQLVAPQDKVERFVAWMDEVRRQYPG